jgi:hypothetical protein
MVTYCTFPHILGCPSSYMTLQLLHSEFPYTYQENFILFFISVPFTHLTRPPGVLGGGGVFSILVPLSLESTVVTTTDLLVVVVVGGGLLVVVVVVVTTSGRAVGGEVRERRAMQGVSLQTRRSLLPPLQAAPPPAAATATPLVRTFPMYASSYQ